MSNDEGRLASLLLRESFGEVIEEVGTYLLTHGPCALSEIKKNLDLQTLQVKKSLCILIQHQLVTHHLFKTKTRVYQLRLDSIVQRIQFPRCIHAAKNIHGDAGEFIVEDVLQQGHASMSQCVERVSERFEKCGIKDVDIIVKQQFGQLVKDELLSRVEPIMSEVADPEKTLNASAGVETNAAKGKGKKRKNEAAKSEPKAKKRKKEASVHQEEDEPGEVEATWQVNHDWFQEHFRDQGIVDAVARQLGETAANVMKTLLSISKPVDLKMPRGKELPAALIVSMMPKKPRLTPAELDQYLKVLVDQSGFLVKTDESGGGTYAINFKRCCEELCRSTLECVVRERFGSKALRVFRLLLMKKMLDQKQVEDMAMLSSKEAREILYTLLADNFVNLQEIPKSSDYAPSRTFYLFSVQLLPVSVMVRERCFKAMGNLISRRVSEASDNKRLLERYQQHEKQLSKEVAMDAEVEDILTPDEKKQAESVKKSIARLEHAELQLYETLSILTYYTQTHMQPVTTNKK